MNYNEFSVESNSFRQQLELQSHTVTATEYVLGSAHPNKGKSRTNLSLGFQNFVNHDTTYLDLKRAGLTIANQFATEEGRKKASFQEYFGNRLFVDCDTLLTDRWLANGKPNHWFAKYVLSINYSENGSPETPRGHIDIIVDHFFPLEMFEEISRALHWWLEEQSLTVPNEDRSGIDVNRFMCNPVGGKILYENPGARLPLEILLKIHDEWKEAMAPIEVPQSAVTHEAVALGYIVQRLEHQTDYTCRAEPGNRHKANFLLGLHAKKAWNSGLHGELPPKKALEKIFQDFAVPAAAINGTLDKYGESELRRTFTNGWDRIEHETYQVPVVEWRKIIPAHEAKVVVPEGEYLADKLSLDMFMGRKTIMIAQTGIGKSHFFASLEKNVILVESLNAAQIQLSAQYGLSMFNSIHKNTDELRPKYTTSYESLPKLVKMLEDDFDQDMDDWLIVADEYHTFLVDNYRVKRMLEAWDILQSNHNVVMMSGTFGYIYGIEANWELLQVKATPRKQKAELFIYGEDRKARAWSHIRRRILESDEDVLHVVYLDNKRKQLELYRQDMLYNDVQDMFFLNSETKTLKNVRSVLEDGYIPHRVMFCTTTAREAISITNEKVEVHVIGIKDPITLQQFVNRFRAAAPKVTIYVRVGGAPVITMDRNPTKWNTEMRESLLLARKANETSLARVKKNIFSAFEHRLKAIIEDKEGVSRVHPVLFSTAMFHLARIQVMQNPISVIRTLRDEYNWEINQRLTILNDKGTSKEAEKAAKEILEARREENHRNMLEIAAMSEREVSETLSTIKTEEDAQTAGISVQKLSAIRAMSQLGRMVLNFYKKVLKESRATLATIWEVVQDTYLYAAVHQIDLTSNTKLKKFMRRAWYQMLRRHKRTEVLEDLLSQVEEGSQYTATELGEIVAEVMAHDEEISAVFDVSKLLRNGRFSDKAVTRFWRDFITLTKIPRTDEYLVQSKWSLAPEVGLHLPPPTHKIWHKQQIYQIAI